MALLAVIGYVLAGAILYFSYQHSKALDKRNVDLQDRFDTRLREIETYNAQKHQMYHDMIEKRDAMMVEFIEQVTLTNTQVAERMNIIQMLMMQSSGGK